MGLHFDKKIAKAARNLVPLAAGDFSVRFQGACRSSNATVSRNCSSRISARWRTARTTYWRPNQSRRDSPISLILLQSLSNWTTG
jgi:hypothetical protein